MHISDKTVFSHAYLEVASATEVTCEVLTDQVEVFVGERSGILGLTNGVTLTLGEEALGQLLHKLTEGLAALKDQAA
jgi:hypothetical protein